MWTRAENAGRFDNVNEVPFWQPDNHNPYKHINRIRNKGIALLAHCENNFVSLGSNAYTDALKPGDELQTYCSFRGGLYWPPSPRKVLSPGSARQYLSEELHYRFIISAPTKCVHPSECKDQLA
jgi:hypothetical protein